MAELDTVTVAVFADKKSADRSLRWLRRAGLDPRVDPSRDGYEVRVPAGPQQQRALEVLHAVELSHKRGEVAKPTGWRWLRNRLVNLETLGVVVALATAVVLLIAIGIWIWSLVGMMGWLALIVVFAAALVYFHFSGIPHSAVPAPRRYSHKHDITMEEEQQVQYRLAWARDQWRRSRESRLFRRRRKRS